MKKLRDSYGNSASSGFTIDFFNLGALGAKEAFLASPFFSTIDPVRALTARGCKVRLLVRLCSITPPAVLRLALADPNVTVRFYTSRSFHAKLYIIDDAALVGSANLTTAGLMTNREVSVVLRKDRDDGFDALPGMFNLFWEYADVFTDEICNRYEEAFRTIGNPTEEARFQAHLEKFVDAAAPPSAKVGSNLVSKKRSFLQSLRRKYDETLVPAFREVTEVFLELDQRRPEFAGSDLEIELGRFLGWTRITHAPGDAWKHSSLADRAQRRGRIIHYLSDWVKVENVGFGDMLDGSGEIASITRLRSSFATPETINQLSYNELFDALTGVHAFYDRLRFVSGGLPGLRLQFGELNALSEIKKTLTYLLHGAPVALERAYDCIFDENRRMNGFGEACVMELLGWMDPERPPINGRTIKALRFLGFDVRD